MPAHSAPLRSRLSPAVWIFLLAFALRLFVLVSFSQSSHFLPDSDDMAFYSGWATRITQGQFTDGKAFYGLPGYAWCLASIYTITEFVTEGLLYPVLSVFGIATFRSAKLLPFVVGVIQALMDAGIAVLLYLISRRVFAPAERERSSHWAARKPEIIGIAAGLCWVFFTPAQTFSIILMPTAWLVLAFYTGVFLLVKTETSSWWNPWLVLGLICGVVAMLVATILFLLPLFLISIALTVNRGQPWRSRLPKIGLAAATLIAAVFLGTSPAWIHNYFIAREPVMLSAHSGINFWIGNNPSANGYPKMPPGIRASQDGLLRDSITLAQSAAGRKLTRAEVSKFWSEQANAYIRAEPFAWMKLLLTKFENFWNNYQYDDLSIIKLLRDSGVVPPGLRFGFIAALGLAGFFPVLRTFPKSRWIGAAVLLHMLAVLTVFITERYRLAAAPGLMIIGAAGLWLFWEALVERRWQKAGLYVIMAGVATWFVSMPRGDYGLWSLDYYKAGIRATAVGDLDRAQGNLETAYAFVPDNTDISFALGNLWLARSERATDEPRRLTARGRAKGYYRRALDLNPNHPSTLNNLGVLAFDEKRYDLAEKFLTSSLRVEPEIAKTHFLLARVRLAQGKRTEARAALDEAIKLRPEQKEFLELRAQFDAPTPAP